jgi:hypothetical protein
MAGPMRLLAIARRYAGPAVLIVGGTLWRINEIWQTYDFVTGKAKDAGFDLAGLVHDFGWAALIVAGFVWLWWTRRGQAPLKKIIGKTYEGERIHLDGYHYIECVFRNCVFVWAGGNCLLQDASIEGSRHVEFPGAQAGTVDVLKMLGFLEAKFAASWKHLPDDHFKKNR